MFDFLSAFDSSELLPFYSLHWTSFAHYILLLGTLFILISSRSDVSIIFIALLALLAIGTAASHYSPLINISRFFDLYDPRRADRFAVHHCRDCA